VADVLRRAAVLLREGPSADIASLPAMLEAYALQGSSRATTTLAAKYSEMDEVLGDPLSFALEQPKAGTSECALCQWLYEWYRTGDEHVQAFVLRFAPILVFNYLLRSPQGVDTAGYEACLVLIYNDEKAKLAEDKIPEIGLPSLAKASEYHEPTSLHVKHPLVDSPATALQDSVAITTTQGSLKPQERLAACAAALRMSVRHLPESANLAALQFCCMCIRLSVIGYRWAQPMDPAKGRLTGMRGDAPSCVPVQLSTELVQALVRGLGFCVHSDSHTDAKTMGRKAAAILQKRTTYDMMDQGVILTRALLDEMPATTMW